MNIPPSIINALNNISFDDIDKAINEILRVENIDSYSYEKLHALFFKYFPGLPIIVFFFPTEGFKDLKLYRARPCDEVSTNEIYTVNTFAGPPLDKDCGIGRANWEKRNVFYGSDTPHTALKEAKKIYPEKEFFVAKWGFDYQKFNADIIQVATLIFENIPQENPWLKIVNWSKENIEKVESKFGIEASKKYIYIFKKISKLFVDLDKSKYKITAYFADQRLYSKYNTQAEAYIPLLIYPSIETKNTHCNFAIHPFFVNQYMRLERVIHIKFNEIISDSFKFEVKKLGLSSNNAAIEWLIPDIDLSKQEGHIESLTCNESNKKFDENLLKTAIFKKGKKKITQQEMIVDLIKDWDMTEVYDFATILEEDELRAMIELRPTYSCSQNFIAIIEDKEYDNFTVDIVIRQPYGYWKIS